MELINLLENRCSKPRLQGPGPDAAQLEHIIKAALRAPDHAQLAPWRYLLIEGVGLDLLGECFAQAARHDKPDLAPEVEDKYRCMPHRAPSLLVLISSPVEHAKVPAVEQILSAGAAGHAILLAAESLGLGAMWRTGPMAYHPYVQQSLGLESTESIAGFIYLGTPVPSPKKVRQRDSGDFLSRWPK